MGGSEIFTLILALIGAVGASLVTGIVSRPKTLGDAAQAHAAGEVALSADARAWVQEFRKQADDATARAGECEKRLDDLEGRFAIAIDLIRDQSREIERLGGHPKPYPAALVPPLPPLPAQL